MGQEGRHFLIDAHLSFNCPVCTGGSVRHYLLDEAGDSSCGRPCVGHCSSARGHRPSIVRNKLCYFVRVSVMI